jgi:urease accessory protein
MTRLVGYLVAALVWTTHPVLAHAPIKGIGAFYNGVLHPIAVPAHLLLLVGLGLLLGQHAPSLSRRGWFAFVAAFWTGLVIGQALGATFPETLLLAFALIAGLLVTLDRSLGAALVAILTAAAGIGIGLDSASDGLQHREMWLALSGTGIGGVLILSYTGGLAAVLAQPWQGIGVRVAGSWTAAAAGIVLALALSGASAGG